MVYRDGLVCWKLTRSVVSSGKPSPCRTLLECRSEMRRLPPVGNFHLNYFSILKKAASSGCSSCSSVHVGRGPGRTAIQVVERRERHILREDVSMDR